MDELLEILAAQETADTIGAMTEHEGGLTAVAAHDAAGEFTAAILDEADNISRVEAALDPNHADREQTAAPLGGRPLLGRIGDQGAPRRVAKCTPLLPPA